MSRRLSETPFESRANELLRPHLNESRGAAPVGKIEWARPLGHISITGG